MPRYFEQYFPDAPLVEISREDAEARTYYIVEHDQPTRYEHFSSGVLDRVIYPDQTETAPALVDLRRRYGAMEAWIYSPYLQDESTSSFTIWYVKGSVAERRLDYVHQRQSKDYRVRHYDQDDQLVTVSDYLYADWGLAEIKTYDAGGNLISHEDCDP